MSQEELTGDQKRKLLESFPSDAIEELNEGIRMVGGKEESREEGQEVIDLTNDTPVKKIKKREMTDEEKKLLEVAKGKLSKWAARLFDPNRPRGLIEPPQTIPLNDEFLKAFGKREKESDEAIGRTIEIDNSNLDDGFDADADADNDEVEQATEKQSLGTLMGRKLKIMNLAYSTTQETLENACAEFGPLVEVNLIMDKETVGTDNPRNSGRAYVTFETAKSAEECMAKLGKVDGRQPRMSLAEEQSKSRKSVGRPGNARYWDEDISTKCFRCGQVGHIESDCRNKATPKPCPLCGKTDHEMRDCSMSKICFRCGLPGHINRDCSFRQNVPKRIVCGICFQSGHHRVSCRRRDDYVHADGAICMVCGQSGHFMCKQMKWFFGVSGVFCFNCGEKGHLGYDCNRPMVDECARDEDVVRRELERAEAVSLAEEMYKQQQGNGRGRKRSRNDDGRDGNTYRPRPSSLPPQQRGYQQQHQQQGYNNSGRNGSRGYPNKGRGYRGGNNDRRHSHEGYNNRRR